MIPFYVNTIQTQVVEFPGIDGSYIYLNCKNLPDSIKERDHIKLSKNTELLFLIKRESIQQDNIFSHYKLTCKILTDSRKCYIDPLELKSGKYLYKPETINE